MARHGDDRAALERRTSDGSTPSRHRPPSTRCRTRRSRRVDRRARDDRRRSTSLPTRSRSSCCRRSSAAPRSRSSATRSRRRLARVRARRSRRCLVRDPVVLGPHLAGRPREAPPAPGSRRRRRSSPAACLPMLDAAASARRLPVLRLAPDDARERLRANAMPIDPPLRGLPPAIRGVQAGLARPSRRRQASRSVPWRSAGARRRSPRCQIPGFD